MHERRTDARENSGGRFERQRRRNQANAKNKKRRVALMAAKLRELMTANPVILDTSATVTDAARQMRDRGIGDVLVQNGQSLCGIITDRDLVVRGTAEGKDPNQQSLGDLCSQELATLDVEASLDDAVTLMKDRAIRRVPILESGTPVGIVSLGDLAEARDPDSALGRISTASHQA
jgi:signal-transduction protein with cAMP-binding, CBS, and nucleotidyltransferase domain